MEDPEDIRGWGMRSERVRKNGGGTPARKESVQKLNDLYGVEKTQSTRRRTFSKNTHKMG